MIFLRLALKYDKIVDVTKVFDSDLFDGSTPFYVGLERIVEGEFPGLLDEYDEMTLWIIAGEPDEIGYYLVDFEIISEIDIPDHVVKWIKSEIISAVGFSTKQN